MMMRRMHMRVFFPVLMTLIFFPVAAFFIFLISSKQYFHYQAERDTNQLFRVIQTTVEETYLEAVPLEQRTAEQEREYSHCLLKNLQDRIQKDNFSAFMIVISSRQELSYPSNEDVAPVVQRVYQEILERLKTEQLPENLAVELEMPEGNYFVRMVEIPSQNRIRGKYLISYAPVTNGIGLFSHIGKLLGGITLACLILSAIIIWLVTGSIVKPLERFCRYMVRIGDGEYQQIEETYSVEEIERLKKSVNQMVKKLKDSEENTRCFFQNASHDLRTPLTSIGAYAQGIQSGVVKDTKKSAEIILTESQRMMELIEGILMISRMDSRALELQSVIIPLQEFIQEQLYIFQGSMSGKKFIFHEGNPELCIKTDPQLLIRIFQNVLSNCSRYANKEIEVSLMCEEDGIVIQIEDDGPGIPDEYLPHIFERFYKGEDGNMGIGLSVVYSGMTYLGGNVTLCNKNPPLHGAIYRLKFPGKKVCS